MLEVSEVFASIQGEGINMGKKATFVRLSRCNLSCSFCDTKYAFAEGAEMSPEELGELITKLDPTVSLLVFTGGEPMLQAEGIDDFLQHWESERDYPSPELALETNGTIVPGDLGGFWLNHVAISPKLPHYDLEVLNRWVNPSNRSNYSLEFKFVIPYQGDIERVDKLIHDLGLLREEIPIVFQPNGLKKPYNVALEELIGWVRGWPILSQHVRVLPQLHRIIWGGIGGV